MKIRVGTKRSLFHNCNAPYKIPIVIAIISVMIMAVSVAGALDYRPPSEQTLQAAVPASTESEALSKKIKELVTELHYPETVAEDFVTMVNSWQDKQRRTVLLVWKQTLNKANQDYMQGKASKKHLTKIAKVEQSTARKLFQKIRKEIEFNEDLFDLADVIKHRQTQCLGYTQLFYLLGNSIGLSVESINVAELRTSVLPTGLAHTASIISLADGKTMMADLMPNGFVSMPFILEREFTKTGDYLELRDKNNFLEIDSEIQILDKNGLVAHIYNNRAAAHSKLDRYTRALSGFNRAIELHPQYAEAYLNRGIVYRRLGRFNEAISNYDRAIELKPNFAEAYYSRAIAYGKLNQFNRAIEDYNKAIEFNPGFAEAYYNRGNTYGKLDKYNQAISDYSKAIKLNPNLAHAYRNRALAYALSGKPDGAKKDLLKVVKLNPTLKTRIKTISDRFNLNLNIDNPPGIAR